MTIKGLKRNGVRNRATSNVCLTDRSLSLQFSVVDGRKVLTFSIDTIRGLCEGAEKLAEWLD
jgi:hypothetical protein